LFITDAGTLDDREELATAGRVALGTDARAGELDTLPDPDSTDRRGWWAIKTPIRSGTAGQLVAKTGC
jgi:hypothetical protein